MAVHRCEENKEETSKKAVMENGHDMEYYDFFHNMTFFHSIMT